MGIVKRVPERLKGRRPSKNRTSLTRLGLIDPHAAWAAYNCVSCNSLNLVKVGKELLDLRDHEALSWDCTKCGFRHASTSELPFANWPGGFTDPEDAAAKGFWRGFFRTSLENKAAYWKSCNACGRTMPFSAFDKHSNWGPLERQMECRACKAAINAKLNPKRSAEQLHEASVRRRIADLLVAGDSEAIDTDDLFARFESRCFKTGRALVMADRSTWAIDHILPSVYLYPLRKTNAALLSREANNDKRDQWPSAFYSDSELVALARITGADLSLLSRKDPVVNSKIDINACVDLYLNVREKSDLPKRIFELHKIIEDYELEPQLNPSNRALLGYEKH